MTTELVRQEHVRLHVEDDVAVLTIGSGRRRNALTSAGWRLLEQRTGDVASLPSVRAVLVRGEGGTFCAGSDMTEWADAGPDAVEESFARMEAAFRAIEQCPVPVVAEVRGVAAGAGCQLALACDLRLMADSARIGMPIARLGILPSPAFAARLINLAGPSLARRLLYTGRLLDAPAAVTAGLADEHVPDAELAERINGLLAEITSQPTAAVRAAKSAVTAATAALPQRPPGPVVSYQDFRRGVTDFLARIGTAAT